MRQVRAAVFAALCLAAGEAEAQDVTLRSRDGGIELNGTMLGFDGDFYRVSTRYGELTVDSSGVLCEGPGCPSLTDYVAELRISGAAAMGEVLLPALIEGFALRSGLVATRAATEGPDQLTYMLQDPAQDRRVGKFTLRLSDTDEGFADLLADEADLVMALREVRPAEVQRAREAGLGDLSAPARSRVLALDGLLPAVAPGSPLTSLALADLARILAGDLVNWQDLGGPDAPIVLHLTRRDSGTVQALEDRLLAPTGLQLAQAYHEHDSPAQLEQALARDPFGFGLVRLDHGGLTQTLVLGGSCGFTLRGSRAAVKTEDYPLTLPLFLYQPARRLPALARDFLAYTRSGPAQIVIRRAGFVDQLPEDVPLGQQGDRLANAIQVAEGEEGLRELQRLAASLAPRRRLTTSFRFDAGATGLDAQSRSNVEQLAEALENGLYDGKDLLFVGFSDGQGPAPDNLVIARQRADTVLQAVRTSADTADFTRVALSAEAFGEAMPMACDDTVWGRQVNRRVEVWLR